MEAPTNHQPTPAHRMFAVQRALSRASSYPIVGTVPAIFKTAVSAVEVASAGAFLLLLNCGGNRIFSSEFVAHEIEACESHMSLGGISLGYGLFSAATMGWGPYLIEGTALKDD